MKKIIVGTIVCCVVSLWSFSSICIVVAQEENGAAKLQYVSEDEVVIHSPIKNKIKESKVFSDNSVSANSSDAADYDDMIKYLEKEMAYLEKLDGKYRATLGGDVKDENRSEMIQENNDVSQAVMDTEKAGIDNAGEKSPKDQGAANDFADLGNVNYDNPYDAAEVFYEMSRYIEALKMYKSLQTDKPNVKDFIWAQFQVANCYRNLGKFDKAVQGYQDFINKYPDNFWTEQALWYLEDAKWWKEWNNRIRVSSE
ncbi:MAG: tetratricopeptide repeat protein [Candidatus Anammoxibacter sp.]